MSDTPTMPKILALSDEVMRVRGFAVWAHGSRMVWNMPMLEYLDKVALVAAAFNGGERMVQAAYLSRVLDEPHVTRQALEGLFDFNIVDVVATVCARGGRAAGEDREAFRIELLKTIRRVGTDAVFLALAIRIVNVQLAREGRTGCPHFASLVADQPGFAAHLFRDGEHTVMWDFLRNLLEPTSASSAGAQAMA